jgi:DUF971 family protein
VVTAEQGTIGGQVNPHAIPMTESEQLIEIRMQQRFPQNMQADMLRVALYCFQYLRKYRRAHEALGPRGPTAETTGEIAAIGHFNIDFFKWGHDTTILWWKEILIP